MIYFPESRKTLPQRSLIGGKAYNLAKLQGLGAIVPTWFSVTVNAYKMFVSSQKFPDELLPQLGQAIKKAGLEGKKLAVRSSAVEEDASRSSFAGQFKSVLGVASTNQDLMAAITDVWESAQSQQANAYRKNTGKENVTTQMAVIIQELVDAEVSGVAFSMDPVTHDPETAIVASVLGLGDALVSGEVSGDTHHVREVDGIFEVKRQDTEQASDAILSEEDVLRIAQEVRKLASVLGAPQDLEWSLTQNRKKLFILQTRPITNVLRGPHYIWDNSNITESYNGVTTPLTFSYVRNAYEEAYRQFGRILGLSDKVLESNRGNLATYLGYINGRVYYNLLNWYRGLAYLPGYSANRSFMEKMMGVSKQLKNPPELPQTVGKMADFWQFIKMVFKIFFWHVFLDRQIANFHKRIDAEINFVSGQALAEMRPDELLKLYRHLEDTLLKRWQAPLVNDFFAMIYFGIVCNLIEKWAPDLPSTIANDLMSAQGGIISTQPAREIIKLSLAVLSTPTLKNIFDSHSNDLDVWNRIKDDSALSSFYDEMCNYIARFGDRSSNELKLETVTFVENPSLLIKMIRMYSRQSAEELTQIEHVDFTVRQNAEKTVLTRLSLSKRIFFLQILRLARARVRDRENLRFERTRTFGLVRRIFVVLGKHLAKWNVLDHERDIFFLTKEEIFGFIETTAVTSSLKNLADLRKKEFRDNLSFPDPPDRFESYGPPQLDLRKLKIEHTQEGVLKGIGCCPGVVRAKARIITDPLDSDDLAGHILVAEKTDPGWTLIFPVCKGILVQRGSLLSHSAIVARELGIPCIVGIPHLLQSLKDGEEVEMDGTLGTIRKG